MQESLKELKSVSHGKLITEIPFIIMLNKQDISDIIKETDIIQILKEEKLDLPSSVYQAITAHTHQCEAYQRRYS